MPKFTPELLEAIRTNTYTEEELNLTGQPLSDKNIIDLAAALSTNTCIKFLMAQYCGIKLVGVQALAANRTLTKLGPVVN